MKSIFIIIIGVILIGCGEDNTDTYRADNTIVYDELAACDVLEESENLEWRDGVIRTTRVYLCMKWGKDCIIYRGEDESLEKYCDKPQRAF